MQTLYLVRHTTPAIAPGVCYGQLDLNVAESFADEANAILRWLPPLQLVISSPLLRARQLAEYIATSQHCELRTDARLVEMHFGAWEGKAWNDIARSELDAWAANLMEYAPPDGESVQQLAQRAESLLRELRLLTAKEIALVCHAGSMRAILSLLGKISLRDTLNWDIAYGAVIIVRP